MGKTDSTSFPIISMNSIRHHGLKYIALLHLSIWIIFALFPNFWANDLPLKTQWKGKTIYPLFNPKYKDSLPDFRKAGGLRLQSYRETDWHLMPEKGTIRTLAGFSPKTGSITKRLQSPLEQQYYASVATNKILLPKGHRHLLGTDDNDYDLFAGLIHGAARAFSVTIGSLTVILLLGVLIGGAAAYFGNQSLFLTKGEYIGIFMGLLPAVFYGFYVRKWGMWQIPLLPEGLATPLSFFISLVATLTILILFYFIGKSLHFLPFFRKKHAFPLERLIQFFLDTQTALPGMLLILTLSLFFPKNVSSSMLIIGLAGYTGLARLIRTDLGLIFQLQYIEAAKALGFSPFRILFRHAFPNIAPMLYTLSLLIASDIILFESALAFLGIGVTQTNTISWGSILSQARSFPHAWWLTLFPSLLIFLTVSSLHLLSSQKKYRFEEGKKKTFVSLQKK